MSDRIYIISDGTGQSAMSVMKAAILQFDKPDVKFTVYSMVDREDQLVSILNNAKIDNSLIAYTMVTKAFRKIVRKYCEENNMKSVDLLGPALDYLEVYLGSEQLEKPGLLRKVDEKYFKRIEAMEFTLTHDDGKTVKGGIDEADLVILGLSRTSKTPTSFFSLHSRVLRLLISLSCLRSLYLKRFSLSNSIRLFCLLWILKCFRRFGVLGFVITALTATIISCLRFFRGGVLLRTHPQKS